MEREARERGDRGEQRGGGEDLERSGDREQLVIIAYEAGLVSPGR
ncbi:hypothetical protein [Streptomyces sp. SID7909]|nr:hypothetical protein [Streptomyces sp. SID7909]